MADVIPKMPDMRNGAILDDLEAYARDLADRLATSNALCAELAEALEGAVKELGEVIKSAESEAVHFDGDDFHERLTAGMKALAKFKEATR